MRLADSSSCWPLAALTPSPRRHSRCTRRRRPQNAAAASKLADSTQAITALDLDAAKADLDAAEQTGPLDHDEHVKLWEQRGIVAAYIDDDGRLRSARSTCCSRSIPATSSATTSRRRRRSCSRSCATRRIARRPRSTCSGSAAARSAIRCRSTVEVVADPKQFLRRATLFVRTRGEASWRAADVALQTRSAASCCRRSTPTKPVSLELYLRAYDEHGNEVLTWADPARPREIPLRYDPPTPWYRTWWAITIASSVVRDRRPASPSTS